ncbi:hypothetical protein CAEBREN_30623 [Caenorhabditis brenneri]|uniref:Uncharacterized protein n=1 Tax=Caenorhabditis brenneri TaxID=135651 RepID=G0PBX7_CAEBE|nr:hypothetical protein CAEBREN_30623 [Caenorhabditis brenneri]
MKKKKKSQNDTTLVLKNKKSPSESLPSAFLFLKVILKEDRRISSSSTLFLRGAQLFSSAPAAPAPQRTTEMREGRRRNMWIDRNDGGGGEEGKGNVKQREGPEALSFSLCPLIFPDVSPSFGVFS